MPAVSTCRYRRVHSPENFNNCPECERDSWRQVAEQLQIEIASLRSRLDAIPVADQYCEIAFCIAREYA